jgi:hypothetical protein
MKNKFESTGISAKGDVETYVSKPLAIEFAKWVSNQQVLDDFWSMSNKAQEEAYELFIKEINSKTII